MRDQLIRRLALILSFAVLSTPLALRVAQAAPLPSDEKRIEDDLEDDGSPDPATQPHKRLGQDRPDELTPPPPAEPPANAAQREEEPPPPPPSADEPAPAAPERVYEREPLNPGEHATSASAGEPIFDWSKHKGETEVQHPFASKGLIRISKDGTYIYKVGETDQKHAVTFHAGMYHPSNLSNPEEQGQVGSTFDENYQQADNPAFMFDYEWQAWQMALGKIGLKVGSGFYLAQGNGHFVAGVNADKTPREVFTFALVPINVGPVYRLQIFHHQLFVPYVEGGGSIFGFTEFRDDNKGPKFGGSLGAYAAGGVALNLTYFDALSRIQLDREYSINNVYLTVEFREVISLLTRYDFTSNLINAGFLMEY